MSYNEELPRVSVIVCTYNNEDCIVDCVESLLAQTYPENLFELIIVDDGSTDRTSSILHKYETISYLQQRRNQGPSDARNAGIVKATGEYVCFTDSDCRVAPDWIEHLISAHRRCEALHCCGVGGVQTGHPDDPPFARQLDQFLSAVGFIGDYIKPHMAAQKVGHNASCNASYLRQVLIDVGGFRAGMFPGEDVDLDRRLSDRGWSIWFTPEAVVFHHRPAGWASLFCMLRSYGHASADNVMIHGFFRRIQLVPFVVFMLLLAMSWALITHNIFVIILGCTLLGLGLSLLKIGSRLELFQVVIFTLSAAGFFSLSFFIRVVSNLIYPPYDMRRIIEPLLLDRGDADDI